MSNAAWNVAKNYWSTGCSKRSIGGMDLLYPVFLKGNDTNLYVDILLDCDQGIMKLQLIDPNKEIGSFPEIKVEEMPSAKNEYKLRNMFGRNKFKGYVPQFNICHIGTRLRIASIPIHYYGCKIEKDIFA